MLTLSKDLLHSQTCTLIETKAKHCRREMFLLEISRKKYHKK